MRPQLVEMCKLGISLFIQRIVLLKCPLLVVIYSEEAEGHVLFLDVFIISGFAIIGTSVGINSCFVLFFSTQERYEWHLSLLLVINYQCFPGRANNSMGTKHPFFPYLAHNQYK